jgi:REP element-mobilizing transposase RayT
MARPIRRFEPGQLFFGTCRTLQGRLLLTPSPRTNDLIGGVFAKAIKDFGVEVYAFVVISNHIHLIFRAKENTIPAFFCFLLSNLATEVGRRVNWHGKFWHRRYDAEPILDEQALLERVQYILAHGVKEGLVQHSREWPGLTCIPELVDQQRRVFTWVDRSGLWQAQHRAQRCKPSDFETRIALQLSVLPCWEGLSVEQRQRRARALLKAAEQQAQQQRQGKSVLGAEQVKLQDPHSLPLRSARSRRPMCHANTRRRRLQYLSSYREFVAQYRRASRCFLAGEMSVRFPRYSHPPPLVWSVALAI